MIRAASGGIAIAGRSPREHVHYTWLVDSVKYNEWCEDDYAWEDPAETAMRRLPARETRPALRRPAAAAQAAGTQVGGEAQGRVDAPTTLRRAVARTGRGAGTAPAPPPGWRVAPPFAEDRPSVVRQHLTAPHSSVAAAAAAAAAPDPTRTDPVDPRVTRSRRENISRGQMAGAAGVSRRRRRRLTPPSRT